MSVSTAQSYVIRTTDGRLVCGRCMDYKNDVSSYPDNKPTEEERYRHVLYVCPQMDAVDRDKYLAMYPPEEDEETLPQMLQRMMADPTKENYLEYIANRLEVIDHTGTNEEEYARRLTKWDNIPFKISLSFQDDGRTLKVFLLDIPPK